tara:strand:- start:164 stop:2008 length:1845 start_codon:yes stop_codon:yes gene_type:complete
MDKEIRNIFENYQDTWSLSPKESFKRDKEFFQYVIESNPHLAPLREFKLKYIFELYKAKLRQELDLDAPGLVNESYNISNEDAFNVLEESTRNVSDQEAYNNVKSIFESICADVLLYKGDVLLEASRGTAGAVARGNYDAKRAAAGAPGAAKPTRKRDYAAEYARRKELEAQRAQAAGQPGETVTDTVTTDTEVAIPASRNVAQPNAAQIKQQQQIRDQESQIKNLQAQQGQPTAAQIQGQAQMRKMQSQLDASQKQIADMEEKEREMSAAQKAESDKQQAAIQDQNKQLMAVLQQMSKQQAQGAQQMAQNAAVDDDLAARMQQTAGRGPQAAPAAPPVIDKETQTTSDTVYGGEKAAKKPGLLSKLGGFAKNILPTAGAIGGAALGSALGPAGMVAGGALGKALGKGAKGFADAPKGTGIGGRLKRAGQTHVGSDLASGAAIGGFGAAGLGGGGEEVVDTAVDTETIDTTTPTTTPPGMVGDTADVNSPEYQATMGQYADTQPALMNRDGSMGPGAEPTMGDGTQRTDADVANAVRDRYGNLMQRNEYGGLGDTDISGTVPEVEDEVTSTDVEVEEAPYGRNPNTGEPLPEPPKGKGGSRLMQLANRINPYAR